jgi:glucose/arabinose dehydrogenase
MALRKSAFMLVLSMAATIAVAQEPQPPQPPPPAQQPQPEQPDPAQQTPPAAPSEPETTGTREVPAEVVSADPAEKSIQVKVLIKKDATVEPEVKEAKIRVDDEAVPQLGTVQPGDKVKLLCRMNGNSVLAVKEIKPSDKQAPEKTPES